MQIETYHADRRALLSLFALADDSEEQISGYMLRGEILVARDSSGILGHAQIVESDTAKVWELKSLAVAEEHRGLGIGVALIEAVLAWCRERGAGRLIVSTAAADTGNLRFYQRRGFRMVRIVRDAFGPATGYKDELMVDGIVLRDQVVLDLDLAN